MGIYSSPLVLHSGNRDDNYHNWECLETPRPFLLHIERVTGMSGPHDDGGPVTPEDVERYKAELQRRREIRRQYTTPPGGDDDDSEDLAPDAAFWQSEHPSTTWPNLT